jgi:pyruvate formate lyase activating enzyme
LGEIDTTGLIFNIQKFAVHDGPGIRTTVFLKGCPLACRWCANAESLSPEPELGFIRERCDGCGNCLTVCTRDAVSRDGEGAIRFDRERCDACGECVMACPAEALTVYGRRVTVTEVFGEVSRDRAFYQSSGGGVTVSGGEPLLQADFVRALFRECRESGIATCLDTSGCASAEKLCQVLAFTDYVLLDIKHLDTERHQLFTGQPNELILANARLIADSGVPMLCRMPLVAGINDDAANIAAMAAFIRGLGEGIALELLPYHRLGAGKYHILGRTYPGETLRTSELEYIESIRQTFEEFHVPCTVNR